MSKVLERLSHGRQPGPRRIGVMGEHGVGKSTFAAGAPDPVFLDLEGGLNDIDCTSTPLLGSHEELMAAVEELYREQHDFRTVVLDSADWAEKAIWRQVCEDQGAKEIEALPYGRGYKLARAYWRELLEGLDALRRDREMHVVLTMHAEISRFEDPLHAAYDRYQPSLHKTARAMLVEWLDELLFATFKVYVEHEDAGFGQERIRALTTGERILKTTCSPAHLAKHRLRDLPDELPLQWGALEEYFPHAIGVENG